PQHPPDRRELTTGAEDEPALEAVREPGGERRRPLGHRRRRAAVHRERHPRPPLHRRSSAIRRYTASVSAAVRSQVYGSTAARALYGAASDPDTTNSVTPGARAVARIAAAAPFFRSPTYSATNRSSVMPTAARTSRRYRPRLSGWKVAVSVPW